MQSWRGACIALALLWASIPGSPAQAQVLTRVTDLRYERMSAPVVSGDGTETLVVANVDPLGTNPGRTFQVFSFDSQSGSPSQITHFPEGVDYLLQAVSVTPDGTLLAFASVADLTGNNADGSPEIFVMTRDGSAITQVTDDPTPNAGSIQALPVLDGYDSSTRRRRLSGVVGELRSRPPFSTQWQVSKKVPERLPAIGESRTRPSSRSRTG